VRKPNKSSIKNKMGINPNELRKVNTVKELISKPPFFILAKVVTGCSIGGGPNGRAVKLEKGSVVTMALGAFFTASRSKDRRVLLKPYKRKFADVFKRYYGQNLDGKNILFLRGGGFGDLLFLQPIMKELKRLYPTCTITVACFTRFIDILSSFPEGLIDYVTPVPVNLEVLKFNDYHFIVEGIIERCTAAEKEVCYDLMAQASGLDIDFSSMDQIIELVPDKKLVKELSPILPGNFVVVQARASSPIRMMPDSAWASIIKKIGALGKKVVLLDRPENEKLYTDFIEHNDLKDIAINLASKCLTINHAIAIASMSDGVVCIDSAFSHIGAALGKPVLGLYGAFKGELRMKYYKNADWVQGEPTCKKGKPCAAHHERKFKCESFKAKGYPDCMANIDEDEVMEKFKKLFIKEEETTDGRDDV